MRHTRNSGYFGNVGRVAPGLMLAVGVALVATALQQVEVAIVGQPFVESIVLAIVLGIVVRTAWGHDTRLMPGINIAAKQVLELAVVVLGASINVAAVVAAGPRLLIAIVLLVVCSIVASAAIGRALGLNPTLALLVACGTSICGNSAIAAVAPVIDADENDVVASVALTAVLGVAVVLTLPLLINLAHLSLYQYGVLAGMTVYAVPQVLAATFPVSALSGQVGTLVKLVRVLMLGPVVLVLALRRPHAAMGARMSLHRFMPWFILGFIALAALRSVGAIPESVVDPLREASRSLTVVAMAALGLSVDVRSLRTVGRPVALAVVASLAALVLLSLTLIKGFGI